MHGLTLNLVMLHSSLAPHDLPDALVMFGAVLLCF